MGLGFIEILGRVPSKPETPKASRDYLRKIPILKYLRETGPSAVTELEGRPVAKSKDIRKDRDDSRVQFVYEVEVSMSFNQAHALLIGVGSYAYIPQANIPISKADAEHVQSLLCNPNLCGYRADHVTLLHDETARRDDIIRALGALQAGTAREDTVLVFYCGHGDYGTDGNYYLTAHDTQVTAGRVTKGTGISEGELMNLLRAIPARRMLLLFNTCHSGEISPALGLQREKTFGDVAPPDTTTDALLSSGEGRIIITACRAEQKSWIGHGKLSIFAQSLADGLSGEGYVPNNNGYIGAFGLYEHLYAAVKEAAAKLGCVQEPVLTVLQNVGPFPVALYRGATDLGSFDARETVSQSAAVRPVEATRSARLFAQKIKIVNVTASGKGAVAIGGNANGSIITTGNSNTIRKD